MNVRDHFPSLALRPHGQRLAFLDSAASALKPRAVLDAMQGVLAGPYANIHRGLYENSARTTAAYEAARATVARFLNVPEAGVVFTRNTTEGINLVAHSWGRTHLTRDSVVVLSVLEHHANIVPWQLIQAEIGFEIRVIPLHASRGGLDMAAAATLLAGADVLAITHMSNVLGVRPDLATLMGMAKAAGAMVLVDGSQAVVHGPVDVTALGADFYVCTGHKLYGPTGIGVLYGRPDLLAAMPPYQGGGDMIETVTLPLGTTFAPPPARFEAGTPAIAEAIGLAAALDWMSSVGWAAIEAHEHAMADLLDDALDRVPQVVRISPRGTGIAAFNMAGCHPADVATLLDQQGIAVRSGHHCAMPLMAALGEHGCLRASIGISTTPDDLTQLAEGLIKAQLMLR